ncbi:MAG: hypothetical protein AB3N33_05190 [Puniceicoccaceae bacterium]
MQRNIGIKIFNGVFVLVALVKLFLVADQEIFGQRFDDMGYALSILDHYYACDPNLNWLFIRPLGFPVFGAICMETGIPYRLCLEFFFLACSYFFCTGLMRMVSLPVIPVISLLVLAFHPWVLTGFNQLLTEPFYFCLMLLLLGIAFRLLSLHFWRWSSGWLWALGFLIAWMMLTRREQPWVMGLLGLLFLIRLFFLRFKQGRTWKECLPQMALVLVPAGAYLSIILLVSSLNYAKWGIFATNEQQAPGFSGLLDTLYKIDTPDPSIWAPVTSRTLEMAMQASPRFAVLREGLFNQNNPHLEYGEMTTGREGELGAWMWWRLYDSLASSGIYTSPKEADEWMRLTTAELESAFDEGRLPKRGFSTSFPLDPNFGIWIPEFPRLFLDTLKRLHYQKAEPEFTLKEAEVPSMYRPLFDQATNRRVSILADNSVEVRGHAFSSAGRLDFIAVEDSDGTIVASTSPSGLVYWKKGDIERLTGREGIFDTAFSLRFIPLSRGPFTLSLWKDGQRLKAYKLSDRPYPHRVTTEAKDDLAATDLTILAYRSPFPDTSDSMKALLRGWAFTATGPLTHVSMVNDMGQFLKLEAFRLEREDIAPMYVDITGSEPLEPLGFLIETPVLDLSPITVQFWSNKLLVHEFPLHDLPDGHWGTVESTSSGIPLTIGIGQRQLPKLVEEKPTLRRHLRAQIAGSYYGILIGGTLILTFATLLYRAIRSREQSVDPWKAGAAFLFILLFLFGRAFFYGLVEAAVVPGVNRYMDCAAPVASVLLALVAASPAVLAYEIYRARTGRQTKKKAGDSL